MNESFLGRAGMLCWGRFGSCAGLNCSCELWARVWLSSRCKLDEWVEARQKTFAFVTSFRHEPPFHNSEKNIKKNFFSRCCCSRSELLFISLSLCAHDDDSTHNFLSISAHYAGFSLLRVSFYFRRHQRLQTRRMVFWWTVIECRWKRSKTFLQTRDCSRSFVQLQRWPSRKCSESLPTAVHACRCRGLWMERDQTVQRL